MLCAFKYNNEENKNCTSHQYSVVYQVFIINTDPFTLLFATNENSYVLSMFETFNLNISNFR